MRREIKWPNGEKLVFRDQGDTSLVIEVHADAGVPRSQTLKHSICLRHEDVDELEKAIMEWRLCPQDGRKSWDEDD